VDPNGHIVKRSVADQINWYFKNGLITRNVGAEQVVDARWAERAVRELGRVTCPKCVE
jgi:hypothetical protein